MIILLFICVSTIVIAGYMLVRNNWVYKSRMAVLGDEDSPNLSDNLRQHDRLPEYNRMMYRYWYVWDISKLMDADA